MSDRAFELFDEYAAAYARGERPAADEYLERAGEEADELARLLERFVAAVPVAEPDEDAVALASAWVEGQSPLLELRTRRGLGRAEVVDVLVERLGLDPGKREKVRRRYHELETGLLDAKRVDQRVWDALAATLEASVEAMRSWAPKPAPAPSAQAYFRVADADVRAALEAVPSGRRQEPDEIDRLFGAAE